MSTIKDVVAGLSEQEKEKLQLIIEECRRRELNIRMYSERGRAAAQKYDSSMADLSENLKNTLASAKEAQDSLGDVYLMVSDAAFNLYCRRKDEESSN